MIERNELSKYEKTWVNNKCVLLNERCQYEKETCMILAKENYKLWKYPWFLGFWGKESEVRFFFRTMKLLFIIL